MTFWQSVFRVQRDKISEWIAARNTAGKALTDAQRLRQEIEDLRGERKQVRTRIEKLLGQMDLLSGA